jgi:hypothetical protein
VEALPDTRTQGAEAQTAAMVAKNSAGQGAGANRAMGLGPKRYQPHPEATRAGALKEALNSALAEQLLDAALYIPTYRRQPDALGFGASPPTIGTSAYGHVSAGPGVPAECWALAAASNMLAPSDDGGGGKGAGPKCNTARSLPAAPPAAATLLPRVQSIDAKPGS